MKRDPFVNPLRLSQHPPGGGPWKYVDSSSKKPVTITALTFWACALKLSNYRKANHFPRSDFEDCQMDLLCKYRTLAGQKCGDEALPKSPEAIRQQEIQSFKRRYEPKRSGGCASCRKKRSVYSTRSTSIG